MHKWKSNPNKRSFNEGISENEILGISQFENEEGDIFSESKPENDLKADRILSSRFMNSQADRYKPFNTKQVRRCFKHIEKFPADKAKVHDLLLRHNDRWAIKIALQYSGKGLDDNDLIQESRMGFLHGCEKFNWRLGRSLTTYVTYWMRFYVERAIKKAHLIRLPVKQQQQFAKVQKAWGKGWAELQRALTPEEIAKETGLVLDDVLYFKTLLQDWKSFDSQIGGDDGPMLSEVVADPRTQWRPADATALELDNALIHETISQFEEEDAKFFRLYHGLGDCIAYTKPQLAEFFGIKLPEVTARIDRLNAKFEKLLPTTKLAYYELPNHPEDEPKEIKISTAAQEPSKPTLQMRGWTEMSFEWNDVAELRIQETKGYGTCALSTLTITLPAALTKMLVRDEAMKGKVRREEQGPWRKSK